MASDETILEHIQRRKDYHKDQWADIRDEGAIDMRYVGGDPWEPSDRAARKAAMRPCISTDEISQYINQTINDIRQNPRAIQVTARGFADKEDKKAEFRADYIRQLEYRSKAQQAYTTMFENAVQRGYGFMRLKARYLDNPAQSGGHGESFNQEMVIEPFVNPDLVSPDPDALRPDGSDMKDCFVYEQWKVKDFTKKFGEDATITDFTPDLIATAKNWFNGDDELTLAEYWQVEMKRRKLLLYQTPHGPLEVFSGDRNEEAFWALTNGLEPVKERYVETPSVVKRLTNGVEILETTPWCPARIEGQTVLKAATSIPIVCCYGKVLYIDAGRGAERKMLSMVRLARDPQMALAYIATSELEQIGLSSKNPYMAYRGQLNQAEMDQIAKSLHEPVAVLTYGATSTETGAQVLPPMQRNAFEPAVQALEVVRESTRRALQAAMGINPLPTEAQRRNQKSGVALERMESASQKGSFHFVDHYEEAITRMGALVNEALPHFVDTARDETVRKANGDTITVRVNDPESDKVLMVAEGEFDVTLSTGPSFNSEREAASGFADTLLQIEDPQIRNLILPLVIKLKNLGPIGDELINVLEFLQPPEVREMEKQGIEVPPQVKAQMTQMGQQLQATMGELQKAQQTIQAKEIESQRDLQKADKDNAAKQLIAMQDNKTKVQIAWIQATASLTAAGGKIDAENTRSFLLAAEKGDLEALKLHLDKQHKVLDQVHEARTQAQDHAHEMITAEQAHQHDLELAQQGHEQALAQGQQAADLAPEPAPAASSVDNS